MTFASRIAEAASRVWNLVFGPLDDKWPDGDELERILSPQPASIAVAQKSDLPATNTPEELPRS